uniref:LisH domain-containing protein n=1 Tax=Heterorhabditis bacteriophora TaxID=37862 RepID=A0A1I7WRL9_HETBA
MVQKDLIAAKKEAEKAKEEVLRIRESAEDLKGQLTESKLLVEDLEEERIKLERQFKRFKEEAQQDIDSSSEMVEVLTQQTEELKKRAGGPRQGSLADQLLAASVERGRSLLADEPSLADELMIGGGDSQQISMTPTRRIPRRPRSLACEKDDNLRRREDIPPDPRASSPKNNDLIQERSVRCLLSDIDHIKLSSLLTGHPAGRGSALLLQAVRQQVSVAASSEYTRQALDWIIDNDVLMLKNRKNSVLCRVLQADGVDSREELARLINTIASYAKGRQYFAVLRGRRLPSSTHDQLIATIQKTSVRPSVQRELLQCGMLEWIVNLLEGKTTPYATEYGTALAVNLSLNTASHSLQLRFADSLSAAACNILNRDTHGPSCSLFNSLVLVWLGCSRVRETT